MRASRLLLPLLLLVVGFTAGFFWPTRAPFGNNRVTQVGIVVRDVDKAARAYADLLGVDVPKVSITDKVDKAHTQYLGKASTAQAKLAFFRLDNLQLELIEPVGSQSTWQESLQKNGEGIHHIAFQVKGMDENINVLTGKGGRLLQRGDFTGGSYSYVDGGNAFGGVIFELLTNE